MEARRRFLDILSQIVGALHVFRENGFNAEPVEDLWTREANLTLLLRRYEELTDDDKTAIESEWVELGEVTNQADALHFLSRELYERFAVNPGLRDLQAFEEADTDPLHRFDGGPRLALVRNEAEATERTGDTLDSLDVTLDAIPTAVLDDVRTDQEAELSSPELAVLDGVLNSSRDKASTSDDDDDPLTAQDVIWTWQILCSMYEQVYGQPPDEAAGKALFAGLGQDDGVRGHLKLVPQESEERAEATNSSFVGPVQLPDTLVESEHAKRPKMMRRLVTVGGALSAVAALALAIVLSQSATPRSSTTTNNKARPLPLPEDRSSSCLPADETALTPHSPAAAIPARHVDTVVLERKNKPNLRVTVTEENADSPPVKEPEKRVRVLNLEHHRGTTVELDADDDLRLTWEGPR